jgi:hypothetical protein
MFTFLVLDQLGYNRHFSLALNDVRSSIPFASEKSVPAPENPTSLGGDGLRRWGR